MSDNDVEYVDEDGNPVDPATLGDDYEIVEEVEDEEVIQTPVDTPVDTAAVPAPAPPQSAQPAPTAGHGIPKALVVAVVAVVVLVGGGLVWGLSSLGGQNTAGDVRDAAAAKSSAAREQVESKSSEVESKANEADPRNDWTACDHLYTATAGQSASEDKSMQLRLLATAPMPLPVVDAANKGVSDDPQLTLLQLAKNEFGVYTAAPANRQANGRAELEKWIKASVTTSDNTITVADGGETDGSDEDAAPECQTLAKRGVYMRGEGIPADAEGIRDGVVDLLYGKGDVNGNRAIVVFDDPALTVGLVELTYVEGGDGE